MIRRKKETAKRRNYKKQKKRKEAKEKDKVIYVHNNFPKDIDRTTPVISPRTQIHNGITPYLPTSLLTLGTLYSQWPSATVFVSF